MLAYRDTYSLEFIKSELLKLLKIDFNQIEVNQSSIRIASGHDRALLGVKSSVNGIEVVLRVCDPYPFSFLNRESIEEIIRKHSLHWELKYQVGTITAKVLDGWGSIYETYLNFPKNKSINRSIFEDLEELIFETWNLPFKCNNERLKLFSFKLTRKLMEFEPSRCNRLDHELAAQAFSIAVLKHRRVTAKKNFFSIAIGPTAKKQKQKENSYQFVGR